MNDNINNFTNLSLEELSYIDGGALAGAVIGYVGGLFVGTVVGTIAAIDSMKSGSSGSDAGKAMLTVVGSSIATGVTYGAIFGP